ncbi:hypothetical protein [Streptococcus jiangjianxini]|uniref:hypothetical protein n=1 Tax=Streptococcus jiangjianxini TaxID=3161189 RepID=UPI0032EAB6AB
MTKLEILEALEQEHGQFWSDDKRQRVLEQPTNSFLKILAEWQDWYVIGGKVEI